jgi:hypothetical protein
VNQGPFNPNPYNNPYNAPQPQAYGGPAGYGAQPYGYGYGGGSGGYEFNDQENAVIAQAAFWARLLGIFLIVTGAVSLLNCNVISFALDLAVGISFLGGATSLTAVVNTQGNDVMHMMTALSKLGSAFKIRVIVTLVAVALLVLCAVGLTLLLLSRMPSS